LIVKSLPECLHTGLRPIKNPLRYNQMAFSQQM
jgi:hypothetical protein